MTKEEVCDWEVSGGGSSEWIRSWERVEKEGLEGRREEEGEGEAAPLRREATEDDGTVDGNGDCSAHALHRGYRVTKHNHIQQLTKT